MTNQPNPQCTQCKGRGRIYMTPDDFVITWEMAKHNNMGRVFPKNTPMIPGTASVYQRNVALSLGTQPVDGSYVQLAAPYPREWERLFVHYTFTPQHTVDSEDSEVYRANTLRVLAPRFVVRGREFAGSISTVSRVRNVSKHQTYTVTKFEKDFIYLSAMTDWVSGDVLAVDYRYVRPFLFVIVGITPKIRYNSPYILEEASALLFFPYYCRVGPDDLFTMLATEQYGAAIIDPAASGIAANDTIKNYWDVCRLDRIIDSAGTHYTPGTDVVIESRNELKWLTTKPTRKYTVQFYYHPTYIALREMATMRTAENKEFTNKINLMQFDKTGSNTF